MDCKRRCIPYSLRRKKDSRRERGGRRIAGGKEEAEG
jgi:hypothetical protein